MSTQIENQVVSMQFDNKHFESNVKTSLSTLEKLKQSLKLQGAAKGFENISDSVKKVNMNPLSNACQTVGLKFNAMYTIADQALRNITNSVQRTATNIAKAFTIDPVKSGFQEYETQINAIQTILANTQSKGTTLADVNEALDTLNTYADKTIYNFTEMARNIGTFTAAGIDLQPSVTAIQGIANLAAVSGSNAQQASTAMYQLSQALASGTVKLMDWNSVVNAGMGGQVFQEALKETARVHGIAIDDMIAKQGSFRETLSEGWLTSEILTETLQKFTLTTEGLTDAQIEQNRAMLKAKGYTDDQIDKIFELGKTATDAATKVKTFTQLMDTLKEAAQSGWTQSWELIIGDFEQAKYIWTKISDEFGGIIGRSAETRNKILAGALENSGWDKLAEKIKDSGLELTDFENKVKEVAREHNIDIDAMVQEYGSLGRAIQNGKISVDILKESLKRLFNKKQIDEQKEYIVKEGDTLSDLAKTWGTTVEEIMLWNKEITDKNKISAGQLLKIPIFLEESGDAAEKSTEQLEDFEDVLNNIAKKGGKELLHESIANVWSGIKSIFSSAGKAWREAFPLEKQSERLFNFIKGLNEFSNNLIVSEETAGKLKRTFAGVFALFDSVTTLLGGGFKLAFKGLNALLNNLGLHIFDVTSNIGDSLVKFNNNINDSIDAIAKWLVSVYELPEVQKVITSIKEGFTNAFGDIIEAFKEFKESFKDGLFTKNDDGTERLLTISEIFEKFNNTVIDKISKIDFKKAFENIATALSDFWSLIETKLSGIGISLENIGNHISGFVESIGKVLSENKGKIIAGLSIFVALLTIRKIIKFFNAFKSPFEFLNELGGAIRSFSKSLKANAIKNIAISIAILAASLAVLSQIKWQDLLKATLTIGAVAAILVGSFYILAKVTSKFANVGDIAKVALSILGLAGALLIFGIAAKKIGSLDTGALLKTGAVLAAMVLGLKAIAKVAGPGGANVAGLGAVFMGMAGALLIMAGAVMIFGSMKTETLVKGGLAVSAFMILMIGVMKSTRKLLTIGDKQSVVKVGGIFMAMATALLLIAASVAIFGKMDNKTLIKGGIAVITFMTIMIGVMKATSKLAVVGDGKSVVKVSGIFASMGAALLMIAASVAIFGNMKTSTLLKGGAAVATFMLMMVGVMKATNLLATTSSDKQFAKVSGTMLAMSTAILMLAGAMAIISFLEPKDVAKGVLAIAGLGGVLALLISVTKNIPAKATGSIIALSLAVAVLAGSLVALTKLTDPGELRNAALCLGGLIGMLSLLTVASKNVTLKTAGSVAILGLVVLGLAGVLALFISMTKDVSAKQVIASAGALSLMITSLSASLLLISKATNKGDISYDGIFKMATALLAIGLVAEVLAGIAIAFLPTIGEQIAGFLTPVTEALQGVRGIGPDVIDGVANVTGAIASLASASAKFAISDKFTGGGATKAFGTFIGWIRILLPTLKSFAKDLSGADINFDNLTKVVDAAKNLAEAAALAPTVTVAGGGFGSKWASGGGAIVSVPMLEAAKNWIVGVAPIVKDLAIDVSKDGLTINKENLDAVVGAANALAEAATKAPSVTAVGGAFTSKWGTGGGGIINWPLLGAAKDWIVGVAPVIQDLAESVTSGEAKNLNKDNLDAICTGAKTLAEAAANAPSIKAIVGMASGPWGRASVRAISIPMFWSISRWISSVKQPIVNLATEVGTEKIPDFNADNLKAITKAISDLCSIEFPTDVGGIVTGYSKMFGFFLGAGISHPMITATAEFIKNVKDPIIALAETTVTGIPNGFSKDNFNAIVKAIADIASAEYPTDFKGGIASIGKITGFTIGYCHNAPQISQIADFIKTVKQPIIDLANETATGLENSFNKDNFEAIVTAIKDIASAEYPEATVGGFGAFAGSVLLGGGVYSSSDITAVKDFIVGVKDPIIALANVTASGLSNEFNQDNFNSITKAIADIASADYPTSTELDVEGLGLFLGKFKGNFIEASEIDELTSFISNIKDPIINLANAVSGIGGEGELKLSGDFKKESFESIINAIVSLASVNYPTEKTLSFEWMTSLLGAFKVTSSEAALFDDFADFIDSVRDPIIKLGNSVSREDINIDSEKLGAVVDSVKILADGAEAIPTTGGFINWAIKGETNYTGFIDFLSGLCGEDGALTKLNSTLSGESFNTDNIVAAATCIKQLALAADAIPDEGGWQSFWSGDTAWDSFTTNVAKFGEGMKAFAEEVVGINPDEISVASLATKRIAESFNAISNTEWYMMQDTQYGWLTLFKTATSELVNIIKSFSDEVANINVGPVNAASSLVSSTVNAITKLSGFSYDTVDMDGFKTTTDQLATSVSDFSTKFEGANPSSAISVIDDVIAMLTKLNGIEFNGASSFKEALKDLATTSISDFIDNFTSNAATNSAMTAGSELIGKVAEGISSNQSAVITASGTVAGAGSSAIGSTAMYTSYLAAGGYVGSGFVSGISSKLQDATNAGTALGKAALEAAKAALDEHSPSKEFYKVGEYAGVGLVNALGEYESVSYNAGYNVGESAKEGLGSAVSKVGKLIDNGIDPNPTIRPVLDLSDVTAGANGINRMFDLNPSVGVSTKLNSISTSMNNRQNGANNDDVIAAINGLGSKIAESGHDTYNINGITYDDGSNIANSVESLTRAVEIERRV